MTWLDFTPSRLFQQIVVIWFPDAYKIAKVKPLIKKGSKTDPWNYRPIPLLPLLSEAFERVVLDQTKEFLSFNKILYDNQSGVRKNQSIDVFLFWMTKF